MFDIGNKNGQKYSMYDIKVLITFDNEQKKVKKSFFIHILEKLKLLILLAPWQGKRNWFVLTRLLCFIPCTKISKTLRICRTKDYSFSLLFHQRAIFFITWTKIWNTKKTNTYYWPAHHIYSRTLVFCYQNCSELLWEKIVLIIEKNFWSSRSSTSSLVFGCWLI